MGRPQIPEAKQKQVLAKRLAGKSAREIAAEVGISKNSVTNIWQDPRNFCVVANERAKRADLIGKVLDAVYSSLIKDLQAENTDKVALRAHALDLLSRGELNLERVMPGLASESIPTPGASGGMSLQELVLTMRHGSVALPATNGNGVSNANGNGSGPHD